MGDETQKPAVNQEIARDLALLDAEDTDHYVRSAVFAQPVSGAPAVGIAPTWSESGTSLNSRLSELVEWPDELQRAYWDTFGKGLQARDMALVEVKDPAGFWAVDLRRWERSSEPFEIEGKLVSENPFHGWRRKGRVARLFHRWNTGW